MTTERQVPPAPPLALTLYVAGDNAFSQRTQANLATIVTTCAVAATIEVVDVLKHPDPTMEHRIFATPTLVIAGHRVHESIIVGDLSEPDEVVRILAGWRDRGR